MNISETFLRVSPEWWATFTASTQNNGIGDISLANKGFFQEGSLTSQSRAEGGSITEPPMMSLH